jgi:hypothetical protein
MRLLAMVFASGSIGVAAASAQVATGTCPVAPASAPVGRISQLGTIVGGVAGTPAHVPYSIVRMNTQVQTLSNGVQITTRTEAREWHDAEGRQRMEIRLERDSEMELQNVSISDPVARESIILHPKSQVAQVTRFPERTNYQMRPVDKAFNDAMKAEYQPQRTSQIENKNETLEPTVIAGECAQGTRWTQVIPAGEMGNDGELRTVSESWMSPRLGIQLRFVTDDPRQGHIVSEVTELHLEPPDPSVFQPPPNYQVFDLTRDPARP